MGPVSYTHLDVYKRQELDCAVGLSELAVSESYTRPVLNDSFEIQLLEARHPIIENALPLGEKYIPCLLYTSRCV